jgi:hypothetical protein
VWAYADSGTPGDGKQETEETGRKEEGKRESKEASKQGKQENRKDGKPSPVFALGHVVTRSQLPCP